MPSDYSFLYTYRCPPGYSLLYTYLFPPDYSFFYTYLCPPGYSSPYTYRCLWACSVLYTYLCPSGYLFIYTYLCLRNAPLTATTSAFQAASPPSTITSDTSLGFRDTPQLIKPTAAIISLDCSELLAPLPG